MLDLYYTKYNDDGNNLPNFKLNMFYKIFSSIKTFYLMQNNRKKLDQIPNLSYFS